jgi:hypothetical protein
MTDRPHGYARYKLDNCRCYVCAAACSRYNENRIKGITAGTWQPWTDAEPVRAHLLTLKSCGMGLRAIAAVAGVDRKRLQGILNGLPHRGTGPQKKVRPALAAAILAVEPTLDNLAAACVIGATGTTRRLRALAAAGWPLQRIAEAMGWTPNNISVLVSASTVTVRTARLVRTVYNRLWNVDPATHGASLPGISHAKARAEQERWAPPAAWDDDTIDDPAAFPDWTGLCGTPPGHTVHRNHRIPMCEPCRTAYNAYRRDLRARHAASAA